LKTVKDCYFSDTAGLIAAINCQQVVSGQIIYEQGFSQTDSNTWGDGEAQIRALPFNPIVKVEISKKLSRASQLQVPNTHYDIYSF
jgi:hypothetical protein